MSSSPFKVKAVYSWGGEDKARDLGFIEGDIIEVLRVSPDRCTYYGKSLRTKLFGSFPARHVKVLHIQNSPSLPYLRYSRANSSSPSLMSTRSQYGEGCPKSGSMSSLGNVKVQTPPPPSPCSSPERADSDLFSLKHQSYSYSDFEEQKDEKDDDLLKSLPPVPPKHTCNSSVMRSSYSQQLLDSTQSTDTNKSSAFGHSDLSATSAGSFMRHKEKESDLFNQMFEDPGKSSIPHSTSFFQKMLGKTQKLAPSLDEQIFSTSDAALNSADSSPRHSIEDPDTYLLERTKSLTGSGRSDRKSRAVREDPELILTPHRFLSALNKNEVVSQTSNYELDSTPLTHVDKYIDQLPPDRSGSLEDFVRRKIDNQFNTRLEKIRAIYAYLTTRFDLIPTSNEQLSTKVMPGSEDMTDILHDCQCTPHQLTWLFFLMAQILRVDVEIVLGHFKSPFKFEEKNDNDKGLLTLNHSWISLLVDGQYRLVDVSLGNPTNRLMADAGDQTVLYDFYFLVKPLDLIYTHTPLHVDNQHVIPPLDPLVQLALPPLYPSFIAHGVSLYKFNRAMFRLHDMELIDFDLETPPDLQLTAKVQPLDKSSYPIEQAFVQSYWKNGRRLVKIKSALPANCPIAFIGCYGRLEEDTQESLLLSVPCLHRGHSKSINWCHLSPLPLSCTSHDIYIKRPQNYELSLANSYAFQLRVYPNRKQAEHNFRCMLVSPSGEFTDFDEVSAESYEARKTVRENGEWKLVVPNEVSGRWHVHARWLCQ